MSYRMLDKWKSEARSLENPFDQLPGPLPLLISEAVDIGWFCELNWDPELSPDGVELHPGLSRCSRGRLFDRRIGAEILELQEALAEAHREFRLMAQGGEDQEMDRGHFLLAELEGVLAFLCAEDGDAVDMERLSILRVLYQDAATRLDVASALQNFSTFAAMYRNEVEGLGGFDTQLIGEALEMAAKLRRRGRDADATPARDLWAALQLRNRVASLLCHRINHAKILVRFAFRHHPDLVHGFVAHQQRILSATPVHSMIRELNGVVVEGDVQDLAI